MIDDRGLAEFKNRIEYLNIKLKVNPFFPPTYTLAFALGFGKRQRDKEIGFQ